MLTQLLDINNKVESCLLEKEALYEHVSGENPKTDVRNYQAVYSGITGNCEGNILLYHIVNVQLLLYSVINYCCLSVSSCC